MELYVLDASFARSQVFDVFESLIWTERFQKEGDFELNLAATPAAKSAFVAGAKLALNESYRVMEVETIENGVSADGEMTLKVTGRSIEKILYDRVARGALTSTTTEPYWALTGTPGAIMRKIFHDICVTGTLDPLDKISNVVEGNLLPAGTISETTTTITIQLEPMTVGDALVQLAQQYDLGFRLLRNGELNQLYFDVYTGSDRTTSQSALPAVVFSPDLDNLQDTNALTSSALYKNCAYVISPAGYRVVYPDFVDPTAKDFERRVLLVKADDITTPGAAANAAMDQRGREELSKNRMVSAFDGEISQYAAYKYGVDYQLGDLVELRNTDGSTNNMRITEQIFVSDKEGDRSYPTLAVNLFITPGSWLGWDSNQKWVDLDASMTAWADQP